jgi:hypothetical protein
MSDPHGPELGRPRYRPQTGAGPLLPGQRQPSGGGQGGPERTANVAVAAILVASVGWILPILGGVYAIRRGNAAIRAIEGSGGALDGLGLAVWARRLGWIYVVAWTGVLFLVFGGPAIQLFYALARHLV